MDDAHIHGHNHSHITQRPRNVYKPPNESSGRAPSNREAPLCLQIGSRYRNEKQKRKEGEASARECRTVKNCEILKKEHLQERQEEG